MLKISRRKLLGASMIGTGTLLNGLGAYATAAELKTKGNIMLNRIPDLPQGLINVAGFPLVEAMHGKRSRPFARGAVIPGGPPAYASTSTRHWFFVTPISRQMLI